MTSPTITADDRVDAQVPHAAALAVAVADRDATAVGHALDRSGDHQALLIALADMVDVTRSTSPPPPSGPPCRDRMTEMRALTGDPDPWVPATPENLKSPGLARLLCRGCTVRVDCLKAALLLPAIEDLGHKAGMAQHERRALRRAEETGQ